MTSQKSGGHPSAVEWTGPRRLVAQHAASSAVFSHSLGSNTILRTTLNSKMSSSGEVSPASVTPATTPSLQGTHAPKYGTVIPNRIFVGGIAANTTAQELKQFFSSYGAVQESKIITDRAGISKGYGFITFETLEDADKIIKKEADNLVFKDRKLNIGPAIKKQAFPRVYEPSVSPGSVMFSNGVPYTYQNGMAIFHPQDGGAYQCAVPQPQVTPQTPAYPMIPQMYAVSQPGYAYQTPVSSYQTQAAQWTAAAAQSQWRWTAAQQSPAAQSYLAYPSMPGMSGMTPDMYGHAAPTYQPDLADASMMEAAPAEGSMVMDPTLRQAYAEQNAAASAAVLQAPHQPSVSAVSLAALNTPVSHAEHQHQQQQLLQQAVAGMAAPATTVLPVHRTPVAYKRPLPQSSRKMMGTPTMSLSPRATPPSKVLITHQRMMSHMGMPLPPGECYDTVIQPLTPPATPEGLGHA